MIHAKLQLNLDASYNRTALAELSDVDTLSDDIRGHGKLGITAEILGQCEQVVSLNPELESLDVLIVHRQVVAHSDADSCRPQSSGC